MKKPNPPKKKTAVRNTKPRPAAKGNKNTTREILVEKATRLLWSTEFDERLLRVIPSPLSEYPNEYTFGVKPHELEFAVFWEYRREIKFDYDFLRQLRDDNYQSSPGAQEYLERQMRWKGEHAIAFIKLADLFPLPITEIQRGGFLELQEIPPLPAFKKLSPSDYEYLLHKPPPSCWKVHAIQLDWNFGAGRIKAEFGKWIDEENLRRTASEKRPPTKRGRSPKAIIERRLQQLAAWRGNRSQLNHGEYLKLKPHSWSDQSAYRTGCKKASEALDDLMKKEGSLLFSDR
jgi:hypothetical protein